MEGVAADNPQEGGPRRPSIHREAHDVGRVMQAFMPRIFLACAFSLTMVATTIAQTANAGKIPATHAYVQAVEDMTEVMNDMTPSGDPSMDFVMMMIPHHQAAIDMAEAYLKYGNDPTLTRMAKNIIAGQKKEIKEMATWHSKHRM